MEEPSTERNLIFLKPCHVIDDVMGSKVAVGGYFPATSPGTSQSPEDKRKGWPLIGRVTRMRPAVSLSFQNEAAADRHFRLKQTNTRLLTHGRVGAIDRGIIYYRPG